MKLERSVIKLDVSGTAAEGYLVRPAMVTDALPGVVVIQEVFGVDDFIMDITDRLASAGYAALAPDLFSYGGKPEPLAPARIEDAKNFLDTLPQPAWFDPAQRQEALSKLLDPRRGELTATLSMLLVPDRPWAQYIATLLAGRAALSKIAGSAGVGCLGFCLGGGLAMRLGCADPELAAAVAFYGFAPPLEAISGLHAKVLALYAENDPRINAGVSALACAMQSAGKHFEHETYPGTRHAFMNDTRANFHAEAMRQAWARALGFLAKTLPCSGPVASAK